MALPAGFPPAWFRLEDGCLMCSSHGSNSNWSARQDLHLRLPGPRPGVLAATLRADDPGGPERPRRGLGSCGDGQLRSLERCPSEDWRTRRELHPQPSRRQRGALLIELRIQKWWSRWVTLPHQLACRASALLVCHDPEMQMAGCLRAARSKLSFGDSAAC